MTYDELPVAEVQHDCGAMSSNFQGLFTLHSGKIVFCLNISGEGVCPLVRA